VGGVGTHIDRFGDGDRNIVAQVGEGLAREVCGPQIPLELAIVIVTAVVIRIKIEWL
jgi:hypothetical protein